MLGCARLTGSLYNAQARRKFSLKLSCKMYFYSLLLLNNLDHSRNSHSTSFLLCGSLWTLWTFLNSCSRSNALWRTSLFTSQAACPNFHVFPPKVAAASWCHIYRQLQSLPALLFSWFVRIVLFYHRGDILPCSSACVTGLFINVASIVAVIFTDVF